MIPHSIRPYRSNDAGCVIDSWWRAAHDSHQFNWIPAEIFARGYRNYLAHAIEAKLVPVQIACDAEDDSQIYGWIAGDEQCLHWAYVKGLYRRNYLCSSLLMAAHRSRVAQGEIIASHWSYAWALKHHYRIHYAPDRFFTPQAIAWMKTKEASAR